MKRTDNMIMIFTCAEYESLHTVNYSCVVAALSFMRAKKRTSPYREVREDFLLSACLW